MTIRASRVEPLAAGPADDARTAACHRHAASGVASSGGLIDRARPLSFRFDGRSYPGFAGDTLASALLANGVQLVGRSFKYHRPRGILTAGLRGAECAGRAAHRRAARAEHARDHGRAVTMGSMPRARTAGRRSRFDRAGGQRAARAVLAGRLLLQDLHVAGRVLGEGVRAADPPRRRARPRAPARRSRTTTRRPSRICDVLVIGGGPAGLMAALAAARAGARVILCDEDFRLGGRLLAERSRRRRQARRRLGRARSRPSSRALPDVRIMRAHHGVRRLRSTARTARSSASTIIVAGAAAASAAPAPLADRREARRAGGGRDRAADRVRRQRPAGRHAGAARCAPTSTAMPRRRAARRACSPTMTTAGARRPTLARAGVADRGRRSIRAPTRRSDLHALGIGRARSSARASSARAGRRSAARASTSIDAQRRARDDRLRRARDVAAAGIPTVHLTCHLGGRPVWNEDIAAFVPGAAAGRHARRRRRERRA